MSSDFPTSRLRRYGMPYPEFKGLLYFRRPSFKLTRNSSRLGSSSSVCFQGRALRFATSFLKLDFQRLLCDGRNFARSHSTSFCLPLARAGPQRHVQKNWKTRRSQRFTHTRTHTHTLARSHAHTHRQTVTYRLLLFISIVFLYTLLYTL